MEKISLIKLRNKYDLKFSERELRDPSNWTVIEIINSVNCKKDKCKTNFLDAASKDFREEHTSRGLFSDSNQVRNTKNDWGLVGTYDATIQGKVIKTLPEN